MWPILARRRVPAARVSCIIRRIYRGMLVDRCVSGRNPCAPPWKSGERGAESARVEALGGGRSRSSLSLSLSFPFTDEKRIRDASFSGIRDGDKCLCSTYESLAAIRRNTCTRCHKDTLLSTNSLTRYFSFFFFFFPFQIDFFLRTSRERRVIYNEILVIN